MCILFHIAIRSLGLGLGLANTGLGLGPATTCLDYKTGF